MSIRVRYVWPASRCDATLLAVVAEETERHRAAQQNNNDRDCQYR